MFGDDFTLCLLLGDFLSDPILAHSGELRVSVYGSEKEYRSRRLSQMYLQIAEGHVLGQVSLIEIVIFPRIFTFRYIAQFVATFGMTSFMGL